jgi:hypothetical protein
MNSSDRQWKALIAFIREEIPWAGKREPLAASTRILHDLRIDGDDAVEIMEKFFDTFNVRNVENFPIQRYFGPEGTAAVPLLFIPSLVAALCRFVLRRPPVPETDDHPLTLGMLLEAMRAGRWDTDAIERSQSSVSQ